MTVCVLELWDLTFGRRQELELDALNSDGVLQGLKGRKALQLHAMCNLTRRLVVRARTLVSCSISQNYAAWRAVAYHGYNPKNYLFIQLPALILSNILRTIRLSDRM